jgi:hypothetical protein
LGGIARTSPKKTAPDGRRAVRAPHAQPHHERRGTLGDPGGIKRDHALGPRCGIAQWQLDHHLRCDRQGCALGVDKRQNGDGRATGKAGGGAKGEIHPRRAGAPAQRRLSTLPAPDAAFRHGDGQRMEIRAGVGVFLRQTAHRTLRRAVEAPFAPASRDARREGAGGNGALAEDLVHHDDLALRRRLRRGAGEHRQGGQPGHGGQAVRDDAATSRGAGASEAGERRRTTGDDEEQEANQHGGSVSRVAEKKDVRAMMMHYSMASSRGHLETRTRAARFCATTMIDSDFLLC